jgi:lipopolysaccharide/colanic/teichoic acid biosynthesis glycosyltransferase
MVPVRDVVLHGDARAPRPPLTLPASRGDNGHSHLVCLVVVGDHAEAERFVADLNAENGGPARRLAASVPLADIADLDRAVTEARPHGVVLLDPGCPAQQLTAVANVCRRRHVPLQIYAAGLEDDDVAILHGDDRAFFAVLPASMRPRPYRAKRLLDITVAGSLLVLFSPFFAMVAALTKVGSPGPAFYVSWRVGAGETTFPCYKFRTMVVDADVLQEELESRNEADGCLFKIKDDPRITPTGRFLRRTSLDELPQLLNVLRGEMSLVGPRPLPLRDVARMDPGARCRHSVLPGLTGLWQTGGRSGLTAADMMRLDLEYIRKWSLGLDLRILWRTAGVVLRGRGAY